jgi:hypothetical protein
MSVGAIIGVRKHLLVAGGESRVALLDEEGLGVGMEVKIRPLARRVRGHEERDRHTAPVLGALEQRGGRALLEVR